MVNVGRGQDPADAIRNSGIPLRGNVSSPLRASLVGVSLRVMLMVRPFRISASPTPSSVVVASPLTPLVSVASPTATRSLSWVLAPVVLVPPLRRLAVRTAPPTSTAPVLGSCASPVVRPAVSGSHALRNAGISVTLP